MPRQRTHWDLTRLAPSGLSARPCPEWDLPCWLLAIVVFCNGGTTPRIHVTFKLRPPHLAVRLEGQDSFPDEAGKWTFISRWGRKNGSLLDCFKILAVPLEWRWVFWENSWVASRMSRTLQGSRWKVGFLSRCRSGKRNNLALKEFPGFSVTASPTSDTRCDIVTLSHTLFLCAALISLCFGGQKSQLHFWSLHSHKTVPFGRREWLDWNLWSEPN